MYFEDEDLSELEGMLREYIDSHRLVPGPGISAGGLSWQFLLQGLGFRV